MGHAEVTDSASAGPTSDRAALIRVGQWVIRQEAQALRRLVAQVDGHFVASALAIRGCRGRVVVIGLGKSGHIAGKLAATLSSLGTPAFFVHAAECPHGDYGMITGEDVAILISKSGETAEVVSLVEPLHAQGTKLIGITEHRDSTLARGCDETLTINIGPEADTRGLAPTASAIATLAMGDALAVALADLRGFTTDDFAHLHPGGRLGAMLNNRVEESPSGARSFRRVPSEMPGGE